MKVAIVREFLTQYGGAERILDLLLELFPSAPVYTLVYDPTKMGNRYANVDVRPSVLERLPFSRSHYKWYLPLMPWATDQIKLPSDIDLVISDSSAYAKGVHAPRGVPHLCYLHTPTRYLWSVRDEYVRDAPIPAWVRPFVGPVLDHHKRWDYLAAQQPTHYIANSRNVQAQLRRYYDRDTADVLFPFVDMDRFSISDAVEDYVLVLGRMEPYKRTDIVLEACKRLGWRLKVAGSGTWLEKYRAHYEQDKNIEFLGRVPDEAIPSLYARAKVFVLPAQEDAGITPLEAMASGRPVLAYGKGGALESIVPGVTGEFFMSQTPEALVAALQAHDWKGYTSGRVRAHAHQFSAARFKKRFMDIAQTLVSTRSHNGH